MPSRLHSSAAKSVPASQSGGKEAVRVKKAVKKAPAQGDKKERIKKTQPAKTEVAKVHSQEHPPRLAKAQAKASPAVKGTLKPTASPAPKLAPTLSQASASPVPLEPSAKQPLVHLPRAGESKSDWFARVAHDYYRFLYATALPITRNNSDAEDAVQNAMMNGLKRLDQLTEPGAIVSWLAMITRNAALDVLRRKKRVPSGGGDATVLPIAAPDKEDDYAMAGDMREVLANAISVLPLSYQEVINARHFDGLEVEDIAHRLGVTANNVRVRLFRAYEKLRESAQVRRALGLPSERPLE